MPQVRGSLRAWFGASVSRSSDCGHSLMVALNGCSLNYAAYGRAPVASVPITAEEMVRGMPVSWSCGPPLAQKAGHP
ncbi:hypothetical protein N7491_002830 [Penicillium cf. griseofulvum]|uniref:Uncharacterized protein n=1 Tax=Penicillium cf. griseofulvum TaxID=2972120 RepID=A0A9W9T214_9EURO|nr:hypothetical protein N7472_003002 [Penicillium cf. griseofulvum]KAJ5440424.1 hypothetical protein N7491_002830 [Penicillium cf. griseofulvum]